MAAVPSLSLHRGNTESVSIVNRKSDSAESRITDVLHRNVANRRGLNLFSSIPHNRWNSFNDEKLETEFLKYHMEMISKVAKVSFIIISVESAVLLVSNFWNNWESAASSMLGAVVMTWCVLFALKNTNPYLQQWCIGYSIYFYYLSAVVLNNYLYDDNSFMRQSMMVTFLLIGTLFFRVLYKYSFASTWTTVVSAAVVAIAAGDAQEAFFGMEGVGYVLILFFLNFAFGYAVKYIDRMYRDEFLIFRHLAIENERLHRRLNAVELIKQGKLDVDDDIKDYLSANFTASSNAVQMSKKSARGPGQSLMMPNTPILDASFASNVLDRSITNEGLKRLSDDIIQYHPRVSIYEQHMHKYAPNTMVTMMDKMPSPYQHKIFSNVDDRMLAIPVVCGPVSASDYVRGSAVAPTKKDDEYCANVARDHPGIEQFCGGFHEFVSNNSLYSLDFPTIFAFKAIGSQTFVQLVLHVLDSMALDRLCVDKSLLTSFLLTIESGYSTDAPYHNAMHAADVVVSMAGLLKNNSIVSENLSDAEKFACIIAAACHDFQHLACNNNFLVKIKHDLAYFYNDQSVLENHHASASMRLTKAKGCDFMRSIADDDANVIRETVLSMILATDMKFHFKHIKDFTQLLDSEAGIDMSKTDDRLLVLRIMMKLCDVAHVLKGKADTVEWTRRINEEFFIQGDAEAARGLPVSPFMDRKTTSIPKSQFVIKPLVQSWCEFCDDDSLSNRLASITSYWEILQHRGVSDAFYDLTS